MLHALQHFGRRWGFDPCKRPVACGIPSSSQSWSKAFLTSMQAQFVQGCFSTGTMRYESANNWNPDSLESVSQNFLLFSRLNNNTRYSRCQGIGQQDKNQRSVLPIVARSTLPKLDRIALFNGCSIAGSPVKRRNAGRSFEIGQ
jgi:hypothetical protein